MSQTVKLCEQNEGLRGFVTQLMTFLDPAERQYTCTKMCPAYEVCIGSKFCEFPKLECEAMEQDVSRLEAENAKLRDLAGMYAKVAKYLCGQVDCKTCNLGCPSFLGFKKSGTYCALVMLGVYAQELGIEVV